MKRKTKRKIVRIIAYALLVTVLYFLIYGVRSFIQDIRHQAAHQKEVIITSTELEEILLQKEVHFIEADEILTGKLKNEYYRNTSEEEKLEILARIGALEAEYLGIKVPEFKLVYLRNDLGGYYNHDEHQIVLNLQHITHEKCSIRTVIHEMFHAYQYACMEEVNSDSSLLWAREIKEWRAESSQIKNDFDSKEGLVNYYTAASEESARAYAEKRTELYFPFIGKENEE